MVSLSRRGERSLDLARALRCLCGGARIARTIFSLSIRFFIIAEHLQGLRFSCMAIFTKLNLWKLRIMIMEAVKRARTSVTILTVISSLFLV